jgi:L-alanine-DL-glutamate epimerase-like enolase superfamily enzyme
LRPSITPGFDIVDGNLSLADNPGWGIEINPEWMALSDYRVSYNGSRF